MISDFKFQISIFLRGFQRRFMFLDKRGLTLVELLVAMGIFLMVATAVMEIFLWGFKGKDVVWEQLKTQGEGRKVVQDFVNEIRRAGQSAIGGYPLEEAGSQEIIFYSNLDSDVYRERIRYFLDNKTLKKGIIKAAGAPLSYVSSTEAVIDVVHDVANTTTPLFYYYDENYTGATDTPLTEPFDISFVRVAGINLLLDEKPTVSPAPFAIQTKAEIRNLKTN